MISWTRRHAAGDRLGAERTGVRSARGLGQCGEFLLTHGGHAAAAGLKIDEEQLAGFRGAFCEAAAVGIAPEQRVAELLVDVEAPLSAFTLQTVQQLERLAPFGQGNSRPLLCTAGVTLSGPPKPLGSSGNHLAMRLSQHGVTLRAVAFGGSDWADDLAATDGPLDVAFRPVINNFAAGRVSSCTWSIGDDGRRGTQQRSRPTVGGDSSRRLPGIAPHSRRTGVASTIPNGPTH